LDPHMFLLYHSERYNTSGTVFHWCYIRLAYYTMQWYAGSPHLSSLSVVQILFWITIQAKNLHFKSTHCLQTSIGMSEVAMAINCIVYAILVINMRFHLLVGLEIMYPTMNKLLDSKKKKMLTLRYRKV
jgi:hypothetical protein